MAKQQLMWTALPNGLNEDGSLRISAMVSPRLTPDADQILKNLPDFVDWPATLSKAKFTIHYGAQSVGIGADQTEGDVRVDKSIDIPDSASWQALLRPDTFVNGFVFENHVNDVIVSYDTVSVHNIAKTLYTELAKTASDDLPKITEFTSNGRWADLIGSVAQWDGRAYSNRKTGVRNVDLQRESLRSRKNVTATGLDALVDAQIFHTPPSKAMSQDYSGAAIADDDPRKQAKWLTFQQANLPAPDEFRKQIDFHQIISAMNQYPRLLRRLGIVIDFVIPRGMFNVSADQPLWITCDLPQSDADGVARTQASNRTRTRLSDKAFEPVPRATFNDGDYRVKGGLLTLDAKSYAVLQTDVDAAGLKLMNFARTLARLASNQQQQLDAVSKQEKDFGAPALRNAGLMLVHRRRGRLLQNSFNRSLTKNTTIEQSFNNNAAAGPDLNAEDLIRGWRIDIWDKKIGAWRSLCERSATYRLGNQISVDDNHEGVVRLAATRAADDNNPDYVYLHEALLSWTGWSLVAPLPGRAIDKDDKSADADVEVPPGLNLSSAFHAKPGSLPRLRYGRRYWIRARMTDLAGNSIAPSPKDLQDESPEKNAVLYTRFEPVQPPALALRMEGDAIEKPAEGESMDRIAIRTFNDTPDKNIIPTVAVTQRIAVESRSNVREAELHSMLDAGGMLDGSPATYQMLVDQDAALIEKKLSTPGPLTNPDATIEITYAALDASAVSIPYLPDPLCTTMSARLFRLPGFPSSDIIEIPAYRDGTKFPFAAPFTIRVFEDPAQSPKFDLETRILHVPVPKAERVILRLSSQIQKENLEWMGIWDWMPAAEKTNDRAKQIVTGQHWMFSPWKNVELVHAVQKPLLDPTFKEFLMNRSLGDTIAVPRFSATCSLKSTARVDLQAKWHEPDSDASSTVIGSDRSMSDHAFSVKITDETSYGTKKINAAALPGIPEHSVLGPDLIGINATPRGLVQKTHSYNDTRYRRVEYWMEATTRFREFMPPSVLLKDEGETKVEAEDNIKVVGEPLVAWVPNSAPPPAPQVLYVVPTFGRTTTEASTTKTRWRRGGGLRIYLDRPWNATGYGEMLAVVLPPSNFKQDPNLEPAGQPYKHTVTQWGNDPIWKSGFVSGPSPKAAAFSIARNAPDASGKWLPSFAPPTEADQQPGEFQRTGLYHPSASNQQVDIAPHDVAYDPERRLWYADIEINAGTSYYPFIRLALARYQPTSVSGAHLSNIVLADLIALTPDRWLSVSSPSATTKNVSVYGFTYSDSSGHTESAAAPGISIAGASTSVVSESSYVEVWVEKLDPSLGPDFGWKKDSTAAVTKKGERSPGSDLQKVDIKFKDVTEKLLENRQFNELSQKLADNLAPTPNISPAKQVIQKRVAETQKKVIGSERQLVPDVVAKLPVDLEVHPYNFWPSLWEGSVTLPPNAEPDSQYRLAVAEYEEYIVDDATPYSKPITAKDRRIVYIEYVPL